MSKKFSMCNIFNISYKSQQKYNLDSWSILAVGETQGK
jgi:hypothetical protein